MDENRLNTIIGTSLENLKQIVDVNTVVGEPINTPSGTVIVPVSKVSIGFVSGGTDYASKHSGAKNNFAGAGGTGVTLLPLGFLAIKASGSVEFISVENKIVSSGSHTDAKLDSIFSFIDKTPDLIGRFKDVLTKKNGTEDGEEEQ